MTFFFEKFGHFLSRLVNFTCIIRLLFNLSLYAASLPSLLAGELFTSHPSRHEDPPGSTPGG